LDEIKEGEEFNNKQSNKTSGILRVLEDNNKNPKIILLVLNIF